jgi:hypothetical protein
MLDVRAQNADAQRMERANGRTFRRLAIALLGFKVRQKLVDALLHFACGLVREGDGENIFRRDSFVDEMRDAISDDARLARARARQNLNLAVNGFSGLTLLRVE